MTLPPFKLGPYFPLRAACLFTNGKKYIFVSLNYYYLINIVICSILSFSKNTYSPFK